MQIFVIPFSLRFVLSATSSEIEAFYMRRIITEPFHDFARLMPDTGLVELWLTEANPDVMGGIVFH